jgi:hypothetical protein
MVGAHIEKNGLEMWDGISEADEVHVLQSRGEATTDRLSLPSCFPGNNNNDHMGQFTKESSTKSPAALNDNNSDSSSLSHSSRVSDLFRYVIYYSLQSYPPPGCSKIAGAA